MNEQEVHRFCFALTFFNFPMRPVMYISSTGYASSQNRP